MQQKHKQKIDFRSQCPISSALDLMGDRWSLLVIRDIAFSGKRTFSEFAASEESIASNILSDRLSRLATLGILSKAHGPDNKKTVLYSLTEKGADLIPLLAEFILWSDKHLHNHISPQARQFATQLRKKKPDVIAQAKNAALKAGNS